MFYCNRFDCYFCDCISKTFADYRAEGIAETTKEEKEECFVFWISIKAKKPVRPVHETEIFI